MGVKSPDSYYIDGKTKGKASKNTSVDAQKTTAKADVFVKKADASGIKDRVDDDMEEIEIPATQEKPSLNERPKFVEKGTATEIPGLLNGFKHHRRR